MILGHPGDRPLRSGVSGAEPLRNLSAADAALCTLRARLDLARRCGLWDDALHLSAAAQTEAIGRQIGGWLRSLSRAEGRRRGGAEAPGGTCDDDGRVR